LQLEQIAALHIAVDVFAVWQCKYTLGSIRLLLARQSKVQPSIGRTPVASSQYVQLLVAWCKE